MAIAEEVQSYLKVASLYQQENLPIEVCQKELEEFLLYWSPRDQVGGDFVWAKKQGQQLMIAVYDCTGHGFAASLKAMTVKGKIDNVAQWISFDKPAELLKVLDIELRLTKDNDFSDDGIDIGILSIDLVS